MRKSNPVFHISRQLGCLLVTVATTLATAVSAQTELYRITGTTQTRFGQSIQGLGDLNGDGFSEFAATARGYLGSASFLRIYSGADGSILHELTQPLVSGSELSVGGGGDVNGDGVLDFCVGLPSADSPAGSNAGIVYVYSGSDTSLLHTFEGEAPSDFFGDRVSLRGDLNGDGMADILVLAARGSNPLTGSGKCRVFSGADGSELLVIEEPSIFRFGTDLDYAGDTNGDGVVDLVVGTTIDEDTLFFNSGSARIYSGVDASLLHLVPGDNPFARFGTDVSPAGDVNLDGFDDVIVGAYMENSPQIAEAYAMVLSGFDGSVLYKFETSNTTVRAIGGAVAGPGDVNQDGYPDLLVESQAGYSQFNAYYGPEFFYTNSGAFLFSGRDGSVLQTFGNDFSWTQVVTTLAGAGDVNGDGILDLMVGNPTAQLGGTVAGAVRVFAGEPDPFAFPQACHGDGGDQMGCTDCPCSNNASEGTLGGCLNSTGRAGRLLAYGSPAASDDQLRMELIGATAGAFAILSSGDNLAPTNAANPCFGQNSGVTFSGFDGLRCSVGNVQRHGTRATDANGSAGVTTPGWGPPDGPTGGLVAQGGFTFGQTRHYQVIYREDLTAGCGTGLNSTQAVSVSFFP